MVGAESFRPRVASAYVVSAMGHFGLIWIVISFLFSVYYPLYHYGSVGQYECVIVVRVGLGKIRCGGM